MATPLKYSNINDSASIVRRPWRNIQVTEATEARRRQLRLGIDDFTSFTWRGVNAFETFGAFIVHNNSLKFYNGPTYSNSYTKPQFDSAYGQLTGMTFNIQKIDFTVGVFWISEEDYRQFIYWLNPYEVNTLTFGFEPKYYYQVKLASVSEGTRYIVGYVQNTPRYYTEVKLSFEVQGPACAYAISAYEIVDKDSGNPSWDSATSTASYTKQYYVNPLSITDSIPSDLATPIECDIRVNLLSNRSVTELQELNGDRFTVSLSAKYGNNRAINLFDITFKNQTYTNDIHTCNSLDIKYNSDSGLLLLNVGDSEYMLLNQLSTSNYGKRIVDSIVVNKFDIPGIFDDPNFDMLNQLTFIVKIQSNVLKSGGLESSWLSRVHFDIRARTNAL